MSDVSCRVTEGHLRYLEERGKSLEPLRRALPLREKSGRLIDEPLLRNVRQRIEWDTYVEFFNLVGPMATAKEQEEFVRDSLSHRLPWAEIVAPAMRLFIDPRFVYENVVNAAGAAIFTHVIHSKETLADGRIKYVLVLPPRCRPLPQFFQITSHFLALMPTSAGWPEAHVEAQIESHRAEFLVTLPMATTLWRRLLIKLKILFGSSRPLRELAQSHDTMLAQYREAVRSEASLREARSALERRVAFLGVLLDESDKIVTVVDCETLRFLDVNAYASKCLGYTREELLDMRCPDVSGTPDTARERLFAFARGKAERARYVASYRRKDGAVYPAEIQLQRLTRDGRPVMVALVEDITDRVRAEDERHRLMAELLTAQRRQTVGVLAGGVAHEFNNVLTPILAHLTLISRELARTGGSAKGRDSIERIEKAVARGRAVVTQILALTGTETAPPRQVALATVVAEAVALFRPTLPSGVELVEELAPPAETAVDGQGAELHQIVLNLLTNAAHALQAKGRGTIRVSVRREARAVRLTVADTGSGMDATTRQRIFEPFFTTKTDGQGSGLGLSIVRDIAARHGAELTVDSTEGKGTAFDLAFPPAKGDAPTETAIATHASASADASAEQRPRLLLVDDEEEIALVLGELLRDHGFDVTTALTPDQALAHVARAATRYDIVVSDMSMPGMSGLQLARALRALSPGLRVCLLTGYAQRLSAEESRAQGLAAVFDKPIEPDRLASALRDVLRTSSTPTS